MPEFPSTRASLLVRLRDSRDEQAWRQFVELYGPLVYGYARRQGLQDADASDVSQEIFQAVSGAVDRLDYDPVRGAFRNWLFTIVRRKLGAWRERQGRQINGAGDSNACRAIEQAPAPDESEATWEAAWRQRLFAWACGEVQSKVTNRTWKAFWRTAVDGCSGSKVADELGISIAAVYLARSRVLARLQESIRSAQDES